MGSSTTCVSRSRSMRLPSSVSVGVTSSMTPTSRIANDCGSTIARTDELPEERLLYPPDDELEESCTS